MTDARTLTRTFGGMWRGHYGTAPCPICQPERRRDQCALSLRDADGRLLAHCFKSGCAFEDITRAAGLPRDAVRPDPVAAIEADAQRAAYAAEKLSQARRLWAQAEPIAGTVAEAYLRARGITAELPECLRFLPSAPHAPSGTQPCAMVANVEPTGGLHRTFLTPDARKIERSAKMMLGSCAGGAARLSESNWPLVVCEGIETGLSLMSGLLPGSPSVWAALSTSGMKALELPTDAGRLTIAADGEAAGHAAAHALASRAHALGWEVRLLPAPDGSDWNDVLMQGARA